MVGGSHRVLRLLPPLKTGRHDIAEILLKVALNTQKNQLKSIEFYIGTFWFIQESVYTGICLIQVLLYMCNCHFDNHRIIIMKN